MSDEVNLERSNFRQTKVLAVVSGRANLEPPL